MAFEISETQRTFKTQVVQPSYLTQTKLQFAKYTEDINSKISNAIKAQNATINLKKEQMKQQLCLIQERKQKESYKMRKMQQYFVKYCEAVLKQDIEKWAKNDQFFRQLFKMYEKRIKQYQQQNAVYKQRIKHLTQDVKMQMRQVRKMELSMNKNVQHKRIVALDMIRQQIDSYRRQKSQQRDSFIAKSFTKETRVKTQISLPSLPPNPQNREQFSIKSFIKIKKGGEQAQLLQRTQHLITEPNELLKSTKVKLFHKISSSNLQGEQKLGYMMPIRTVKEKYGSSLGQLEKLLDWYRQDQQKQISEAQKLFTNILYNQRNYKKIKSYLNSKTKKRIKTVATQR